MRQNYYGEPSYYVYIITNKPYGVYYTGVTSDIVTRTYQHKNHYFKNSFTEKYNLDKLVWFEQFRDVNFAIKKEKQIKRWHREWKENLITKTNPNWNDLWEEITSVKEYTPPPPEYFYKVLDEFNS